MRIAAISDIHANHIALKAILNYLENQDVKVILFLGDYITDCPYPQKTMKLLYEFEKKFICYFIRGNREDYIIRHHDNPNDGWKYSSSTGSLLYTYKNLTDQDITFFKNMPISMKVIFNNYPPIFICHGSPIKTKEWLFEKDDLIKSYIKDIDCNYFLFGHTHKTYNTVIDGNEVLFCPSAGLPTNNDCNTQFIILESFNGTWKDKLVYLPYDRNELINEFHESGLTDKARIWTKCIIRQIETGTDCCAKCVKLARTKASINEQDGILPEKYWDDAARELGIS